MEVLTRASSGTDYTYYRYMEGAEHFEANFTGQPVTLGADKLILGIDKWVHLLGFAQNEGTQWVWGQGNNRVVCVCTVCCSDKQAIGTECWQQA